MATPANTNQNWRFGVFEVDGRGAELRRGGAPVKMREQSFRILVYLLEHAGEIVTREELRGVLWPSDTFVDFDHSLNTAVMKLRDALGDSIDAPLYIETIPKRGYRFIAPISQPADVQTGLAGSNGDSASPPANTSGEAEHVASTPIEGSIPDRRFGWPVALIGLVLIVAVGLVALLRWRRDMRSSRDGDQHSSAMQIVPITNAPGDAVLPSLSPDGREIAFVWDGPERKHYDVYVQLVGSEMPLRLTYSKSGLVGAPAWSPDGSKIAFSRCSGKSDGVYIVPSLGGAERKLTTGGCYSNLQPGPVAWLSDGHGILMNDRCSAAGPLGVVLFSLATGEKQCLTERAGDFSVSPDGKTLAFIHWGNIYTVRVSGGAPRHLSSDGQSGCDPNMTDFGCSDLMWTPDGRSIVFVSSRATLRSLWVVPADGGALEREETYPAIGSFSKDGRRLVYSEKTSDEGPSIWRADLSAAGSPVVKNRMLIRTQYPEMDAQPSPDGAQIVWKSRRTGFDELWTSGANGESPVQLTHLDAWSGTPRWSPDGKWVAFDCSNPTNDSQILVIDAEGRKLHSITGGPAENAVPSWSRDGKSIYFASERTGSWQVWKHSLESGAEVQLTEHGGFDPFESYDGETIYFSRFAQAGIWSIPASRGMESLVIADKPQVGFWGHWAVTKNGLYLLDNEAEPRPTIEFYGFTDRRISPVLTLDQKPAGYQPSLSATADGKTIYYTQYDRQSVIKMMEIAQ